MHIRKNISFCEFILLQRLQSTVHQSIQQSVCLSCRFHTKNQSILIDIEWFILEIISIKSLNRNSSTSRLTLFFFLTQNTLYIAMFASLLLFCSNDIDFKLNAGFFLFTVHEELRQFFVKLLRKIRKSVQPDKLDSALSKFCYTYSAQDAWEIERFGYKKSSLSVKVRILKVRKYDFFHTFFFIFIWHWMQAVLMSSHLTLINSFNAILGNSRESIWQKSKFSNIGNSAISNRTPKSAIRKRQIG